MLTVAGASWVRTRLATYVLTSTTLIGMGIVILSYFRVPKDGTYSATVRWNHRGGYKIEFWGQNNDLETLMTGAARAYYKTRIHEIGWSMVEIETSDEYPDSVQAYSAGLLEGSLTWQVILHHWHNTIVQTCADEQLACAVIRQKLRNNAQKAKEQAEELADHDPFWHMVKLFYTQLDGLEAGWKCAVSRSRQNVEIPSDDFIWLAIASNLPSFKQIHENNPTGAIFLKNITDQLSEPLLAILHNTVAPYSKMLRLLKKYTFSYHMTEAKNAERVPIRSIVSSSYPGALSSQDEYYVLYGEEKDNFMVVTGMPLVVENRETRQVNLNDEMSLVEYESHISVAAPKIMAANWLASDSSRWARSMARRNGPEGNSKGLQWVIARTKDSSVWIVEQRPGETYVVDYTKNFKQTGRLFCNGKPIMPTLEEYLHSNGMESNSDDTYSTINESGSEKKEKTELLIQNSPDNSFNFKVNDEPNISLKKNNSELQNFTEKLLNNEPELRRIMSFRGDFQDIPKSIGSIDSKIFLLNSKGLNKMIATSGPVWSEDNEVFEWSVSFPKQSHIGHPEKFNFKPMIPHWVWV